MSSERTPHGSSNTRSSQVRIQPCSGDCALVRSRRSISLAMAFLRAVGRVERRPASCGTRRRRRRRPRRAPCGSPTAAGAAGTRAAACRRPRRRRCGWSRRPAARRGGRGPTSARSRGARPRRRRRARPAGGSSARSAQPTTASARAPGSRPERRISGSRRDRRSSATCSRIARTSRAMPSTRGVGRGSWSSSASAYVAPRSDVWTAAMRAAGLDAHDGDRLAGRQRADVGHLGHDRELRRIRDRRRAGGCGRRRRCGRPRRRGAPGRSRA